jgi:UTP--glucose-1-phosphate uridylyltransferase
MLPVGRQPAIAHVRDELALFGVDSILIVTGRTKRAIEDHFDNLEDLEDPGPRLIYVRQSIARGTGDAIAMAEPYVCNEPFMVALGDTIMGPHPSAELLKRMERAYFDFKADIVLALQSVPEEAVERYGIAAPKGLKASEAHKAREPFLVEDIVEKPPRAEAPSRLAVAARYTFSPAIFDYLRRTPPAANGEIQSTDAMRLLIKDGGTAVGVPVLPGEESLDVGNFGDYFNAVITFAMHDTELGEQVRESTADMLARWAEAERKRQRS